MRAFVVLWVCSACLAADQFDVPATFVRHGRDRTGDLHIASDGVRFTANDRKAALIIRMEDLRDVSVADARALQFETYAIARWKPAERTTYTFRIAPDAPLEDLARFFAARLNRPVVGHYEQSARFQIPAFHRHLRRGVNGMLRIGDDAITFASKQPGDSRTWLYRDIETIGQPDSYRFRVTTARETYVLELKRELSEEAYRFAWKNVYEAVRSAK